MNLNDANYKKITKEIIDNNNNNNKHMSWGKEKERVLQCARERVKGFIQKKSYLLFI